METTGQTGGQPTWYLVQSKPRQGQRAETHLQRQGYECFYPRSAIRKKTRQGSQAISEEPLFPGYLFIRLRAGIDSWQPIRSTRGVQRLVTFGNRALPVADSIIEQIQARTSSQPAASLFQPGEKVRISDGPFADLEAVFQCFDGEERVILLLNIMQRQQTLRVPLKAVDKAAV